MKKILISLAMLASTQSSMAAFTPVTTIESLYVYDTYAIIKTNSVISNTYNCTKNNADQFLYVPVEGDGGKAKYSAVLSAYVAGSSIRLGYAGCASWGDGTVSKVYGVSLYK